MQQFSINFIFPTTSPRASGLPQVALVGFHPRCPGSSWTPPPSAGGLRGLSVVLGLQLPASQLPLSWLIPWFWWGTSLSGSPEKPLGCPLLETWHSGTCLYSARPGSAVRLSIEFQAGNYFPPEHRKALLSCRLASGEKEASRFPYFFNLEAESIFSQFPAWWHFARMCLMFVYYYSLRCALCESLTSKSDFGGL